VPLALAAGIAVMAVTFWPLMEDGQRTRIHYDTAPVARGELQEQEVLSANPKADAERLADTLRGEGASPRVYQDRAVFIVDYALDAREAGKAAWLPFGAGQNRVYFRPQAK
jgi:hypothetical protein